MKKALFAFGISVLLFGFMAISASAATGTRVDINDAARLNNVSNFNLGPFPMEYREALADGDHWDGEGMPNSGRQSIGSSLSPELGIGKGVSIDLTWSDEQYTWGIGRQICSWYNGLTGVDAEVSVHFAYRDRPDTVVGIPFTTTGYNVYDATVATNNWPRGQDDGCDLEASDDSGNSWLASMDMMDNGRAVIATSAQFFVKKSDDEYRFDNLIYYQGAEFNCVYDPRSGVNVTWVDTSVYRPNGMDVSEGNYARDPQIATQWDGTNTVVHLVMGESNGTVLSGSHFPDGGEYRVYSYYRRVGNDAYTGSWSTGQIIDTMWFVWGSLAAAKYPDQGVAYSYTNASYYGALLNNAEDNDVWYRESLDRGLSWEDAVSVTNYENAIAGDAKAWLETFCMYTSDGNLHIIFGATPTSADPYFDGFNWNDFNNNLYHWDKASDDIVKVANGNFMNPGNLDGSMNTFHCGFGGSNALYLSFAQMGECDGKLYAVWAQIHERANRYNWRDAEEQPAPGVLDDCSVVGERLAMANWEILMSVAKLATPDLWDYPRNITDTYTPNCGIIGLEGHEDAEGPCGSEWKPTIEKYALDESGLSLTWPAEAEVDMSPGEDYNAGWYLNMEYMDDQFPGPYAWGRTNPPGTENSEKWIRLACVEPIEASQISIIPFAIEWPEWVELGMANAIPVTVINEGNVMLNVTDVSVTETTGSGWLSASITPTSGAPFQVTAGVDNTDTFDINVDASGLSVTTWLDGEVVITSDAANYTTVTIPIHVLAASEVEPVMWDTVMTHENMFTEYFTPEGECIALMVGNNGDLGWGAGSSGGVNLDYYESEQECSTERGRDRYYLMGSTAFTILADASDGTGAKLTQSTNDPHQGDETGWDPIGTKGSLTRGLGTGGNGNDYAYVYTGAFVNRDTTIAMERTVYGPRSADPTNEIINFVVMNTKVYSGDGAAHSHVTIGNVCDWDVPSDAPPFNKSGLGSSFVYMQGTDTLLSDACQSSLNRYATEAFGGGYTSAEWEANNCVNGSDYFGSKAYNQLLMVDTTHTRAGVVLDPDQPLVDLWWDSVCVSGLGAQVETDSSDQAVWFTYVHDYDLGATDTLNFWTVLTTVRNGTLSDLEAQVSYAKNWYTATVRGCAVGCCVGRVGDANGSGVDEPTIGDVSVMIDAKFITGSCAGILECLDESDINQSGPPNAATCADVTIGDISILIDYLFITGPSLGLNACF
ncbi:MAG: hypothetical protein J7J98_01045 [candidate division Zixibacteria bacterium]|nr:hypothetical protein [candidate division Zixibacteria bacterium]